MIKKFIFGSCLAFGLFNGDCWGMKGSNDMISSVHSETRTQEMDITKHNQLQKAFSERDVLSDSSDSSSSVYSLSEEEEEMADRACYGKLDIVMLLAHLQSLKYSEAKAKYNLILQKWNDNNVYELTDTGDSFIGCCERNYYDF